MNMTKQALNCYMITQKSIKCYEIINALVPHLIHEKNNLSLHNKVISKNGKYLSPNSFVGTMACSATCWVLHHMLKHKNIETKLMKKSIGSGDYYKDHCFLLYNNEVIIDPTYKQFFVENVREKNNYTNKLFNNYPFVFVGDISTFKTHYNVLNEEHKKIYKKNLETEVSDFWIGYKDFSNNLKSKPNVKQQRSLPGDLLPW